MTSTAPPSAAVGALALLAELTALLAREGEIVGRVSEVLDRLRASIGAEECALWLYGGSGLVGSAISGNARSTAEEVAAVLAGDRESNDVVARRLVAGTERLGAVTMRRQRAFTPEETLVLDIVATLLGHELAQIEQLHRLRATVEQQGRQVDEERRFTERIIDSLPVGLYVIDRNYVVRAWNRNRETGYQGVARDRALGRPIFEVLHRQSADSLRKEFDTVFESGRIQQFHIESTAGAVPKIFRITRIPMRLSDGPVSHVISIGEDITDWTKAQERFAQSDKLAALGQLAAGVMHEINNPMATIAACAESLKLRLDDMREAGFAVPPQADEFTRIIENEVHRCKRIVDGLLDFSRAKSSVKEPLDLGGVIEQTLFLVRHHKKFKQIQLHTLIDGNLELVYGNFEQLVQVFMALLLNAADAMNGAGTVTIRARRGISRGEAVVAEVIDEGHGIARSDLARIFEPFYTTKPPGRGTGLGLSICYSIIAEHGGRIEVDSALGAGSTFRILLPAAETAAAPEPASL